MKLSNASYISGAGLAIVAALGFLAGLPSPPGNGYNFTHNGVASPNLVAGDAGMYAGFCDAGLPCSLTGPSGGGGSITFGAFSTRPVSPSAGAIFILNDPDAGGVPPPFNGAQWLYDGTTWRPYILSVGSSITGTQPPAASNFTSFGGTLLDNDGTLVTTGQALGFWTYTGASLGTTFQVDMAVQTSWDYNNGNEVVGIIIGTANPSASSYQRLGVYEDGAGGIVCQGQTFNQIGSPNAVFANRPCGGMMTSPTTMFFRIMQDVTTVHFYESQNGVDYDQLYQTNANAYTTAGLTTEGRAIVARILSFKVQ